jgi:hypothetical protein
MNKKEQKKGVIFFHGNLFRIHDPEWSAKCIQSIRNQTIKDLYFYEINFGDDELRLLPDSKFFHVKKKNYVDAMNFIITEAFNDGCDFVFNTNIDDIYHPERIQKQIEFLNQGYDLVSSDFCYIDLQDVPFHHMHIKSFGDIRENLDKDHNVIAHPCVAFSQKFWSYELNRYDINNVGREDLDLWKSSINRGYQFYIVDEILLHYRIHNNQVTTNNTVGLNR